MFKQTRRAAMTIIICSSLSLLHAAAQPRIKRHLVRAASCPIQPRQDQNTSQTPLAKIVTQWSVKKNTQRRSKKTNPPLRPSCALPTPRNYADPDAILSLHEALYLLPLQLATSSDIMRILDKPLAHQSHTIMVNLRDRENNTPLHLLAMASVFDTFGKNSSRTTPNLDTCQLATKMINMGAHVDALGQDGNTPLFVAAGHLQDDPTLVELLLGHGANPNARAQNGNTPLFEATSRRAVRIAAVLLRGGADVNAQNARQETALHILLRTYYAHPEIQKYECTRDMRRILITSGAHTHIQDSSGETPLSIETKAQSAHQ